MDAAKLTTKQRLFVEAYLGAAKGNATEAARMAGYKGNIDTLKQVGAENLTKPYIAKQVEERVKKGVITADEILTEMRKIFFNSDEKTNDRLKAGELLGKHLAMWTDKTEHSGQITHKIRKFSAAVKHVYGSNSSDPQP